MILGVSDSLVGDQRFGSSMHERYESDEWAVHFGSATGWRSHCMATFWKGVTLGKLDLGIRAGFSMIHFCIALHCAWANIVLSVTKGVADFVLSSWT